MRSKLIIEGNAVYELDEECVRRKRGDRERRGEDSPAGKKRAASSSQAARAQQSG